MSDFLEDYEIDELVDEIKSTNSLLGGSVENKVEALVDEVRHYRKLFGTSTPIEDAKNNKLIELVYWNGRLQDSLSDLVRLSLESKSIRKKHAFNIAWNVMTQNPFKIALNSKVYSKLILLAYHNSIISIGKSCELLYTNQMDFRRRYAEFLKEVEQSDSSCLEMEKSIYNDT